MAQPKSVIDLPLAVGIDTKSDPKVAKGLLELINGEIRQSGLLSKRRAFEALSRNVIAGGITEQINVKQRNNGASKFNKGYALYAAGDNLYLHGADRFGGDVGDVATGQNGSLFAVYDSYKSAWVPRVNNTPVTVSVQRAGTARDSAMPSVAQGEGYTVAVSESADAASSRFPLQAVLRGESELVAARWTSGIRQAPKGLFLRYSGSRRYIEFSGDPANNDLKRLTWVPGPDTTFTAADQATDLHTDGLFDCCASYNEDAVIVVYKESAAGEIKVMKLDATGTSVETTITIAAVAINVLSVVTLYDGTTERYAVMYQIAGNNLECELLDTDLASVASTTLETGLGTLSQVTGTHSAVYDGGTQAGSWLVAATDAAADAEDRVTSCLLISFAGAALGSTTTLRHCVLVAKAFTYEGRAYLPVAYNSALQPTYFLLSLQTQSPTTATTSDDPVIVTVEAKILYGRAGGAREYHGLSMTQKIDADAFMFAGLRQDRIEDDGDVVESGVAIVCKMGAAAGGVVNLGKSILVPGGIVAGINAYWHELGFHIYPENITVADQAAGVLSAGAYSYRVMLEWADSAGQIHRTAPSVAASITLGATRQTRLTVKTNHFVSSTKYNVPYVKIIVYRTEAGGSAYYRATSGIYEQFTVSADTMTIDDNTSDATLITRERLYTDSGELEPTAPPGSGIIAASHNRAFLVPYDDPTTIWYTKPKTEAYAPEFVDGQYVRIDNEGDATGLTIQDGQVIVFKKRAIYVFGGEGPNALGLGEFYPPRKLATSEGCVDPRSVITYDEGTIFRSEAGYRLLDRSYNVQPIGLPVEAYKDFAVAAAFVVPNLQQIWFVLKGQRTVLVFDYLHKLWGTHELEQSAMGACYSEGIIYFVAVDGTVFRRDTSKPAEVPLKIKTPWYKSGSVQGYQSLWWLQLLGELDAAFKVTVYYDYGESPYTSTHTYAAKKGRKMVRIKPRKKKCTSFRLDIEQIGKLSLDMGVNALSIAFAQKGRLARLASAETK